MNGRVTSGGKIRRIVPCEEGDAEAAEGGEEDKAVEPPKAVRWYPNRLAWQFTYSRQQLRRLPYLEVSESQGEMKGLN